LAVHENRNGGRIGEISAFDFVTQVTLADEKERSECLHLSIPTVRRQYFRARRPNIRLRRQSSAARTFFEKVGTLHV
jgi:hypothetical protein